MLDGPDVVGHLVSRPALCKRAAQSGTDGPRAGLSPCGRFSFLFSE
jgi:hypothetical protein